ncbi:hypothetical protein GOP47_0021999 [Adiantum capillus-veneris]|uniref:Uncharacterized protein n=1 Tax=Adiantum capillus-veneris TaxID=13818 RepID=A0A9D4U8W7_ADICA|nr:hypothetical protein GOP47_0021999 [Adiantum capillus-veneris]
MSLGSHSIPINEDSSLQVRYPEPINENSLNPMKGCTDRIESDIDEFERANLKQEDGGSGNAETRSISFFKLFNYADSLDWFLMLIGALGAAAHGAAVPVFFIFFGKLIDTLGSPPTNLADLSHEAAKYSIEFIYLSIAAMISGWVEVSCWMYTGERQSGRIRVQYLKAMLDQDVGFFDTEISTGEIVVGISSDTILVQEAIGEKTGNFIHYMSRFLAGFGVGFSSVWQLSLVTLSVVPLIAMAGGLYAYVLVGLTNKSQEAYVKAGEISEQVMSQIRTVYAFGGEKSAVIAYTNALKSTLELGKKGGSAKGLGMGVTYCLLFGAWALLLWYSGKLVRDGVTNGGQAFTTILNVIISGLSLGQVAPDLTAFGKAKVAGFTLMEMISRTSRVDRNECGGTKLSTVDGHIELKHVFFSYPSRPKTCIFQDFSLDIPAGKIVAIVGGSGSGKSTVISLVERFYDPIKGEVLLDGHNLKHLQLRWLRDQLALVNQEPALFATTLRENILYGKDDATLDDIIGAAKISGADTFIKMLPNGYETQVGERGVQLSGGQKQRIAIARAMIKNPTILLLDEATSALDAESEKSVQEALDRVMMGRTTVVVAHRLSTIGNADFIAVVQDGRVVEYGTHAELMSKAHGAYSSLVKLQEAAAHQTSEGASMNHQKRGSHGSLSQRSFSFQSSAPSEQNLFPFQLKDTSLGEASNTHSLQKPFLGRLLKMNSQDWPYGLLGALGAITAGAETPLFAFAITQCLVAFYSPDEDYMKNEISKIALIFCGTGVVTIFIYWGEHYFFGIVGERLTMRVREMMFSAILRNEIGWFDKNNSNLLAARLSSDGTLVKAAIADRISTLLQNLGLVLTAFIIAFWLEWRIALVIVATYPALIASHISENLFLKGFGGDLSGAYARANMVAGEAVGNIRTIVAFCAEEKVVELFNRELATPQKQALLRGQIAGIGYGVAQFLMYSAYGLGLWYSSTLIAKGEVNFGAVMKCFMVLIITALGIAETLALAPDIVKGSHALSSVFEILDRETEINPDDPEGEDVKEIRGAIELKHVDFSYPSRPGIVIFKDFNLKVHPGRSIALVGASGSGKSTVVGLIARFYDPLVGQVLIDGKDIRRLNLKSLRQHTGLVQQEPALFSTSIYENIRYGKENATEGEIIEAAKAANAHDYVCALMNGYETEVGERGVQLSGGQKQRIAIARAVLRDPAILLLDEATSALDAESEKLVQEALDRLMMRRTTVLVAHRLSTIKNANKIAVLQDGIIVEQGTHSELMAKSGAYFELVSLQQNSN